MQHDLDLHKLANEGGAGEAMKCLRDAGLWDEHAGQPEREFLVGIEWTETAVETVKARSEAEAEKLALEKHPDAEVVYVEGPEDEA